MDTPLLIIFAGLPGTGETTLSRALAAQRGAVHGYAEGCDNLRLGRTVTADSVNPLAVTRAAWRAAATAAGAAAFEIEVICSDPAEHRRRIESRVPDIPNLKPRTWQDVCFREYEAWDPGPNHNLIIGTAHLSVPAALQQITASLSG